MITVIQGNVWDYHAKGHWITVTTNCNIKANGHAVMGKGIALQAKQKFPHLPEMVGKIIKEKKHSFGVFPNERVITFPTKVNWFEESSIELISRSFAQLLIVVNTWECFKNRLKPVYCVKFGCSNGRLNWDIQVKPLLDPFVNETEFVFVDR